MLYFKYAVKPAIGVFADFSVNFGNKGIKALAFGVKGSDKFLNVKDRLGNPPDNSIFFIREMHFFSRFFFI